MKTRTLIYILFLLLFGIYAVRGNADDFEWPRWRGPNGDGISNETNWDPEALAGGLKILWKVDLGRGYSNVAIKDNRLYTIGLKIENLLYIASMLKPAKRSGGAQLKVWVIRSQHQPMKAGMFTHWTVKAS